MNTRPSAWKLLIHSGVWATLIVVSLAATAAAKADVHVLDRPVVIVLAHDPDLQPRQAREITPAATETSLDPGIQVTNVPVREPLLPSVTIATGSQTIEFVIATGTSVAGPTTTTLPTVGGTTETSTSTTIDDDDDDAADDDHVELPFTGTGRLFIYELILAFMLSMLGSQILLLRRRRLRHGPN